MDGTEKFSFSCAIQETVAINQQSANAFRKEGRSEVPKRIQSQVEFGDARLGV
jgi:hypothetical protein